jgi:hypothetical protein
VCGPPIPLGEPQLAAEVKHERLEWRRRVEGEADGLEFLLGGDERRPEAAQVLHEHQRVLLLLVEPDRHECREVGVPGVVPQEHLGGRKGGPLGDGVVLHGEGLLVGEARGVEAIPGDVRGEAPAGFLEVAEQFGVEHDRELIRTCLGRVTTAKNRVHRRSER